MVSHNSDYYNDRINEIIDNIISSKFQKAQEILIATLKELSIQYQGEDIGDKDNHGYVVTEFLFFRFNSVLEDKLTHIKDSLEQEYPLNSKLLTAVRDSKTIHSIIFQLMCNFSKAPAEYTLAELSRVLEDYEKEIINIYPHRFEYNFRGLGKSNLNIYVDKGNGGDEVLHILGY